MAVKSIVRNLFVSGVLVLSGGVVCGRPVSADFVADVQLDEDVQKDLDNLKKAIDDQIASAKCFEKYDRCIFSVIEKGNGAAFSTPYITPNDIMECMKQRQKCFEKIN